MSDFETALNYLGNILDADPSEERADSMYECAEILGISSKLFLKIYNSKLLGEELHRDEHNNQYKYTRNGITLWMTFKIESKTVSYQSITAADCSWVITRITEDSNHWDIITWMFEGDREKYRHDMTLIKLFWDV